MFADSLAVQVRQSTQKFVTKRIYTGGSGRDEKVEGRHSVDTRSPSSRETAREVCSTVALARVEGGRGRVRVGGSRAHYLIEPRGQVAKFPRFACVAGPRPTRRLARG